VFLWGVQKPIPLFQQQKTHNKRFSQMQIKTIKILILSFWHCAEA
jgi:hypothetical protein